MSQFPMNYEAALRLLGHLETRIDRALLIIKGVNLIMFHESADGTDLEEETKEIVGTLLEVVTPILQEARDATRLA